MTERNDPDLTDFNREAAMGCLILLLLTLAVIGASLLIVPVLMRN